MNTTYIPSVSTSGKHCVSSSMPPAKQLALGDAEHPHPCQYLVSNTSEDVNMDISLPGELGDADHQREPVKTLVLLSHTTQSLGVLNKTTPKNAPVIKAMRKTRRRTMRKMMRMTARKMMPTPKRLMSLGQMQILH
jgi:hypothetical protein